MPKRVFQRIRKELRAKDRIRERALELSRTAIRLSAQAILSIHKGKLIRAERMLKRVRKSLDQMDTILKDCPEIAHKGFVYTAYQEYCEANLLLSFVSGRDFPTPDDLSVPPIPYTLGLADVVGELRRRAIDSLRVGDSKTADRCLDTMEGIYESFLSIERGYALIPGFKGKRDAIRSAIERTRADVLRSLR
ncbi:MAG: hypothetical protein ACE5OY_06810 [Candidatus Bathyarchaeia archaeon]